MYKTDTFGMKLLEINTSGVAGLPLDSTEFAVLPPHFRTHGSDDVARWTTAMFPAMASDANLLPILRLCLASLVYHTDYLRTKLPANHHLLATPLFRDPTASGRLRLEVITNDSRWMRASGIPPHIALYKQLQQSNETIARLPDVLLSGFARVLDEKGAAAGNITRSTLEEIIRGLLAEAGLSAQPTQVTEEATTRQEHQVYYWGNKFYLLPEPFDFPSVDPLTAWKLWWFGHAAQGWPAFRAIKTADLSTRKKGKSYSEWAAFMKHVINAVEVTTGTSLSPIKTETEASEVFDVGMRGLGIVPPEHTRRWTQLKMATVLSLIREAKQAEQPERSRTPYRKRRRQARS